MKVILLLALIVAAVQAFPQGDKDTQIVTYVNENDGSGPFHTVVKLSDGQASETFGELQKNPDPKEPDFVSQRGEYSYTDPEGTSRLTKWIADHLGYRVL